MRAGRKATGLRMSPPGCRGKLHGFGSRANRKQSSPWRQRSRVTDDSHFHRLRSRRRALRAGDVDRRGQDEVPREGRRPRRGRVPGRRSRPGCEQSGPHPHGDPVPAQPDPRPARPADAARRTSACARPPSATRATWSSTSYFEHTTPKGVTMVDRILRARYVRDGPGLGARREPRLGHRHLRHAARRRRGVDELRRVIARTCCAARTARSASASSSACRARTRTAPPTPLDFGVRR